MKPLKLLLALLALCSPATAQTPDDIAGRVLGDIDGQQVELPLLKSDYKVELQGDLASVTLTQTFENPYPDAMSAEYLFPLNQKAAVHAMEMEVGDEIIAAQIQKKAEAEATFEAAESEGKAAALLTQHRPNMFTQRIANLMPGLPVTVRISYVQPVRRIDGAYELVVPLVVGPRYEGAPIPPSDDLEFQVEANGWEMAALPDYPKVIGLDLPDEVAPERVALDLTLTSAVPVISFTSATHGLTVEETDTGALTAQFPEGRVIDNRDLVIRYALGEESISAGVLTHSDERGDFLSLIVEPPTVPDTIEPTPREIVFVLD